MYIFSHKRSISLRIVVFALVAMLLLPSIAVASPEEDSSDIDALRAQATRVRIRLDQLTVEMQTASEDYFEAKELLEATIAEIEETEMRLDTNQEQLSQVSELLSERAVSAYQGEQRSFIAFLFESNSFSDLIVRINLLQIIMDNDANMIREARMLRSEIEAKREQLEEKRATEQEAAEQQQREFESVQRLLSQQQSILASLDDEVLRLIEEERVALAAEQARLARRQAAEERNDQEQTEEPNSATEENQDDEEPDDSGDNDNQSADNGNDDDSAPANDSTDSDSGDDNASADDGAGSDNSASSSNGNNNAGNAGNNNASDNNSSSSTTGNGNNTNRNNNQSTNNTGSGGSNSSSNQGSNSAAPTLGRERPGAIPVARRFVGVTPYLWGGTTPAGFDCSGLVQHVYREAYGINLPRTSRQQFHAGVFIPPNHSNLMRPGDLVFFSSTGRPENIYHVGIFVGNNRMIHAPSSGRLVSEQPIWFNDFIGAVRP